MKRLQGDARWQRDFGALGAAIDAKREHVAAGHQLLAAGAVDEAKAELALADEAQARIDLLQLLQHGYSVRLWCSGCKRGGPNMDLQKYVDQGKGALRPQDLGLRHQRCRRPLEFTVHPASRFGK